MPTNAQSQSRAYLQKRYSHNVSNAMFIHNKLKMSNIGLQNGENNDDALSDINTSRQSAQIESSQLNFNPNATGKQ
jgi:hypothetical protein